MAQVQSLLGVTLYEVSVAVHVMVAIVALGPTFAFPVIQMTAEKAFPRHLPFAWAAISRIDHLLVSPLVLLIFATGIYQWVEGPWDMGRDHWLSTSFALLLVMYLSSFFIFHRAERRAREAAEAMVAAAGPDGEVQLSDEYRAATRAANIAGPIFSLGVLVIVYLMIVKPF